jgi:hypothetical protein
MSKQAIHRSLCTLAVPLFLATGCGDAAGPDAEQATVNDHIAVTKLEITSADAPALLHPIRVAVEAELTGAPYSTDLLIGMRSSDGETGCVLGAMRVEHGGDLDADASAYVNEAVFVVDQACYELVGRDDIELFASFDPWNRIGDREPLDSDGTEAVDIYSIVAAARLSVEGCETCEARYELHENPGLDAQLRELNLSSSVVVLPVAAEGNEQPSAPNRPDFGVTTLSRVTGLAKGEGLDDGSLALVHRIRPIGSSDEGLPLTIHEQDQAITSTTVAVPSHGDLTVSNPLYIEAAAREAIIDGAWSNHEEFELVTCLEPAFDQAIYDGESDPRANDCAAVPLVIVRQELGADGLPPPNPGAAKARSAQVWSQGWGGGSGYGFGYSGLAFKTWLDDNASDGPATTYKGIPVHTAGSWFEAGVFAEGTVFSTSVDVVDIYATLIGYDFGGGGVAMGASIFTYEFIPEFELQVADGIPLSLQEIFDAVGLNIDPTMSKTLTIYGVEFDDGCGSVNAGLWLEGTVGIDTEQTTFTMSSTDHGVKVEATVTPFMDISANAGTTVNYSDYVSGGIQAVLYLLELDVPFTVSVEYSDYSPLDAYQIKLNEYASAHLTTLSGHISFSINYKIPWPACWSNCEGDHTHTIASWNGYDTSIEFFDWIQTINWGTDTPSQGWCTDPSHLLLAGDFDGDGDQDYMCNYTLGNKAIDYSDDGLDGTDWYGSAQWCATSNDVLVGDFNGDGRDDILCNQSTSKLTDFADQDGKFFGTDATWNTSWCSTSGAAVISTGDYNQDGRDDLLCHNKSTNMKYIDYADANGHFSGSNWSGTQLPNLFCALYDGETIALKTTHDRYLRANNGSSLIPWVIDQTTDLGTSREFLVVCDGEVASFLTSRGRYLQANGSDVAYVISQNASIGSTERFTPVLQVDDGKWAFLTHHNRYVTANGSEAEWYLTQASSLGNAQKFEVLVQ